MDETAPPPASRARDYLRIGHKGAAALAPENTIASLAAALEHDVDLVEFDVVDAPEGVLVLGHSHEELEPGSPTLDEALAFLARVAHARVGIDLDLKSPGFEEKVVNQLRRHGLVERTLVSSFHPASLRRVRALEPALRTGISYPWDRRDLASRRGLAPAVRAGAWALRAVLPFRIAGMVAAAEASAAMLHHSVLSAEAVERCHREGVNVFAWTIDEPQLLDQVLAAGVDGVISNDPRIFDSGREPR
jgi:glycerophosphoryl diester phosphodiesterase